MSARGFGLFAVACGLVAVLRWGKGPVVIALFVALVVLVAASIAWYVLIELAEPEPEPHTLMLAGAEFHLGEIPAQPGVYLVGAAVGQAKTVGRFKVGYGGDMANRVSSFQTGSPIELFDVGYWPTLDRVAYAQAVIDGDAQRQRELIKDATRGADELEDRLHDHYAEQRLTLRGSKREWIDADEDMLAELAEMGALLNVIDLQAARERTER